MNDQTTNAIQFSRQLKELEAAEIMNVSREKLRHDRMLRIGPPVRRYGRSVRYDFLELTTWMASQSTAVK